ncbi:MAG: hypothetical protein QOF59_3052, partial [Actinomycetota bacterium]|nr:hypothetical protein [Actinomycetota bacterium]
MAVTQPSEVPKRGRPALGVVVHVITLEIAAVVAALDV